jgi:hypothetical protein
MRRPPSTVSTAPSQYPPPRVESMSTGPTISSGFPARPGISRQPELHSPSLFSPKTIRSSLHNHSTFSPRARLNPSSSSSIPSRRALTEGVAKTSPLGHGVHPGRLVAANRAGHLAREDSGTNRVDADLHTESYSVKGDNTGLKQNSMTHGVRRPARSLPRWIARNVRTHWNLAISRREWGFRSLTARLSACMSAPAAATRRWKSQGRDI